MINCLKYIPRMVLCSWIANFTLKVTKAAIPSDFMILVLVSAAKDNLGDGSY